LPARAEWNHVVEITAAEAAALRRIPPLLSALRGLTPFALCQAGTIAGPTGAAVALLLTAAIALLPIIGSGQRSQLAAELSEHDLSGVLLHAALVGVFAGFKLTLDVDQRTFLQVLLREVSSALIPNDDAAPLCPLLVLAGLLVLPALARSVRIALG
jgi:hypothetical protein